MGHFFPLVLHTLTNHVISCTLQVQGWTPFCLHNCLNPLWHALKPVPGGILFRHIPKGAQVDLMTMEAILVYWKMGTLWYTSGTTGIGALGAVNIIIIIKKNTPLSQRAVFICS